jgi:hypothetical protein
VPRQWRKLRDLFSGIVLNEPEVHRHHLALVSPAKRLETFEVAMISGFVSCPYRSVDESNTRTHKMREEFMYALSLHE